QLSSSARTRSAVRCCVHHAQFVAYLTHFAQQHRLTAVEPRIAIVEPHDHHRQDPHIIPEAAHLAGQPLQRLAYEGKIDMPFISHDCTFAGATGPARSSEYRDASL